MQIDMQGLLDTAGKHADQPSHRSSSVGRPLYRFLHRISEEEEAAFPSAL